MLLLDQSSSDCASGYLEAMAEESPGHGIELPISTQVMSAPRHTAGEVIEQARHLLREGQADDETITFLETAVGRFPKNPEIRLLYGTALSWSRPAQAPLQLGTAIKLDPDDPYRLTRAATVLFHLGEIEAAKDYAARAVQFVDEGFGLLADLVGLGGELAALDGDFTLAEEALREAAELEPDRPDLELTLARFLASQDQTAEALSVIARALARIPQPANARDDNYQQWLVTLRVELESS